jgi:hypothetical protein
VGPDRPEGVRRTPPLLLVVLLLLTLAAAPATTPVQHRADGAAVFQITFHGEVAIASWTTCPAWEVGLYCEETVAIVSDAHSSEHWPGDRLRERTDRVVLQRFWYEVVELVDPELGIVELTGRPIRDSFGGTDDATVTIDTRARTAVARAAAIPMITTDYEADGDQYAETAAFEGRWEATGPIERLHEGPSPSAPGWIHLSMTRGWQRSATAAGTVDGQPITAPLAPDGAVIIHARQKELSVYPPRAPR